MSCAIANLLLVDFFWNIDTVVWIGMHSVFLCEGSVLDRLG